MAVHPSKVWTAAAWPAAIVLVAHRVFIVALNGTPTDDFTTVYQAINRFLGGEPVYEQAYRLTDPLYLYTPGATLALAPLGMLSFGLARAGFIAANAVAIFVALAILTRIVGKPLKGPLWPASILLAFATESVTNTLAFTNINGLLLVALAGFLWGTVREKGWVAGASIGLAILIKPQFAPLLFLSLVKRDWRGVGVGLALPVVTNLVAWPLIPGAGGFISNLMPYLKTTRDFANSSLPGARVYFDMPGAVYYLLWLVFAGLVAVAALGLLAWREDTVFWALSTSGVLMVGIFFLSNLGQQYYSMWLFPMMFTVVLKRSVFHTWGAWLAAFFFLAPLEWASERMPNAGHWMTVFGATIGWALLIAVSAAATAGWFLSERGDRIRA